MPSFESPRYAMAETKPPRPDVSEAERRRIFEEYTKVQQKHQLWKSGKGPSPTVAEYEALCGYAERILAMSKVQGLSETNSETPSELLGMIEDLAAELERCFHLRFRECGKTEPFMGSPELPEGLTIAHLEAIKEVLGGGFRECVLPRAKDIMVDEDYVDVMYPVAQRSEDTDRNLTSYRPSWWEDKATDWGTGTFNKDTTKGQAFTTSMHKELEMLGGSLVLLDTAIKPNYTDGSQHYGSIEGKDAKLDPLLPLFREAFGKTANRFNHSWDELETKLFPLATKKIQEELSRRGLPMVEFTVMLVPASLDTIEMTFKQPESSNTGSWEWSSTPLIDDKGTDTGRRLVVGRSENGGAASVDYSGRGNSYETLGARLAVVFKKRD